MLRGAALIAIAWREKKVTCLRSCALSALCSCGSRPADIVVAEGGKGTFGKVLLCEDVRASHSIGESFASSAAAVRGRDRGAMDGGAGGGRSSRSSSGAGATSSGPPSASASASSRSLVAIKVVRRVRRYTEAARIEADILGDVMAADPSGAGSLCVRFLHAFTFKRHFCMAFEPLGPSLYDFVKANGYRPPPLYCVQAFADQLLRAVAFLHGMRLVHTDLKLENILLVSREPFRESTKVTSLRQEGGTVLAPASTDIRLIDFGGATFDWEHKSSLINTRQYRAPEVILGLGWSMASDVWSLGCILMELYSGELLFQTVSGATFLATFAGLLIRGSFPCRLHAAALRVCYNSSGSLFLPVFPSPLNCVPHFAAAR